MRSFAEHSSVNTSLVHAGSSEFSGAPSGGKSSVSSLFSLSESPDPLRPKPGNCKYSLKGESEKGLSVYKKKKHLDPLCSHPSSYDWEPFFSRLRTNLVSPLYVHRYRYGKLRVFPNIPYNIKTYNYTCMYMYHMQSIIHVVLRNIIFTLIVKKLVMYKCYNIKCYDWETCHKHSLIYKVC